MKICRYDDDRMGVVRGDLVHDVTEAQTEIRKAMPYAMKGDAVVAALPQWRERIERMADKAPGKPIAQVKLLPPVARPTKLSCAPTNYQAHIAEMDEASQQPGSQIVRHAIAEHPRSGHVPEGKLRARRPVGRHPNAFPRPAQRSRGRAGHGDRQDRQRHSAVQGARLCRLLCARSRHDRARPRGSQFSQIGRRLCGARAVDGDRRRDSGSGQRADQPHRQRRDEAEQNTSQLIYNCRRLIEFASEFYTLYPGDLVYTGTPDGVGPVKPGDVIVCRSAPALGELKINVRADEAGRVPSEQRVPT